MVRNMTEEKRTRGRIRQEKMQHEKCGKGLGRKGQEDKHEGIKKVTRLAQIARSEIFSIQSKFWCTWLAFSKFMDWKIFTTVFQSANNG